MTGVESLVAALLGGLVTSAAPCVLAAVPVAVGYVGGQATSARRAWALSLAFVVGMNVALLALGLLAARLGLLLGALPGPWSIAVGMSMLWGAALLLAYGLGHSVLLLLAGAMPSAASALARRFAPFQAWIPGRRAFALVMFAAGLWWIVQGFELY
jgi:cytochrome c biogenesis protein CcdA